MFLENMTLSFRMVCASMFGSWQWYPVVQFKTSSLDPAQSLGKLCVCSLSGIYSDSGREIVLLDERNWNLYVHTSYAVSFEKDF